MTSQEVARNSSDRTHVQCERILDAAEHCFIRHGFHAASMASIAETAHVSAGLIYRYFENKQAIIKAIIERQLRIMRADLAQMQSGSELIPLVAELFAGWQRGDPHGMSPVLYLDMSAEASRDAQIAAAVAESDRIAAEEFRAWLRQATGTEATVSDVEVEQRMLLIGCLIDGLALRSVRDPDLDPALVAGSLKKFLPHLLPRPVSSAQAAAGVRRS